MRVQCILFDNALWTVDRALDWLVKHNFERDRVDLGAKYLRFKQSAGGLRATWYSMELRNQGIVFMY